MSNQDKPQAEDKANMDGGERLISIISLGEELISIGPIERITNVGRQKWYLLACEKKIPSYRCGRALRFKLSEILAWMKD